MPQSTVDQLLSLAMQDHKAGRLSDAERAYQRILAAHPAQVDALHMLGVVAYQAGRFDDAINLISQAIALSPRNATMYSNLGAPLRKARRVDEAIAAYRRAISLDPNSATVHNNLGNALADAGLTNEAIAAFETAIELKSGYATAHSSLGSAFGETGQVSKAIHSYRMAIALGMRSPELRQNLAHALLAKGEFLEGWAEYEWRAECEDFASLRHCFAEPRWDGRSLDGQTLLIRAEQGQGNTIQFIHYLPMVAQRAPQFIVEVQPSLKRLLSPLMVGKLGGIIVGHDEPLPSFDFQCPLLSLPKLFRTTLQTVPSQIPYLTADPHLTDVWRTRLAAYDGVVKIGVAWAGGRNHVNDHNRSIVLTMLAPLATVGDVQFISLQKGAPASQTSHPPAGMDLLDLTADVSDFADTAALIANLDLVICVDTAVAHLAGALGKPVWTLLPFTPDWRWMLARQDSPWYPTMRLFRQPAPGDWNTTIGRVAAELSIWIASRRDD